MPIIKSAIKRVRQTKVKTTRNNARKRLNKETLKKFLGFVSEGKIAEAGKLFPSVQKSIDLMVKNNLWHKNKASRKKASLSKLIADTKAPKAAPKTEKKAPAKKAPAKKAAPKK